MFIPKCKKCGGKVISAYTNIEIETNGVLKTVTNTPAEKMFKMRTYYCRRHYNGKSKTVCQ